MLNSIVWLRLRLTQAMCAENKDTNKTGRKQHIHCSAIPQAQQNVYVRSLYTATLYFYTVVFRTST